jgi:hypothetical protein
MALNPWEYANKSGTEHAHQVALFMWSARAMTCGVRVANDPANWLKGASYTYGVNEPVALLKWLHAIHNQGHGDAKRGATARAEGVRAGVPDICLPVPQLRPGMFGPGNSPAVFHGLYIELKRPDSVGKKAGETSEVQDEWIKHLRQAGYKVEVCYGWLEARACILKYLGIG